MKNHTLGGIFCLLACALPQVHAQPLTADPPSLSFTYEPGTAVPARQTVKLDGSLFGLRLSPPQVTSGAAWLSASLALESTPDTLTVAVNPLDLAPGKYQGSITITSPAAPSLLTVTIPVALTIGSTVTLQYQLGYPPAPPLCFTADLAPGSAPVVSAGPPAWLVAAIDPASPRRLCVSVNPAGLFPGTFTGTVSLQGSAGVSTIVVVLNAAAPPAVSAGAAGLSFTHQLGAASAPAPQTLAIASERPAQGVDFALSTSGGAWLKAAADAASTPARVTVSIDPAGLAPGTYRGAVALAFTTSPDPLVVPVDLTVLSLSLSASPASLTFLHETGAPASSQSVAVSARGAAGENLAWTFHAAASDPWLLVTPSDIAAPGSLTVSFNPAGLAKGVYTARLTVSSPEASNSPQTIGVTLRIVDPTLRTSVPGLEFTAQAGAPLPAAQKISVTSGTAPVSFTASVSTETGSNWLTVTPGSPLRTPQTLSIAPSRDLPPGVYSASIALAAPATATGTLTIPVTYNVRARPALQARPAAMTFLQQAGGDISPDQFLRVTGAVTDLQITGSLMYRGVNYLYVDSSGTTPADVFVEVDATSFPPGNYTGSIVIASSASNSPLTVPVTVKVKETAVVTALPASLAFTYLMGGNTPEAQLVTAFGTSIAAFTAAPVPGVNWLIVTPPAGFTAVVNGDTGDFILTGTRLNVTVNAKGMPEGVYTSSIVIQTDDPSSDRVLIPVTLNVRKNLLTLPWIPAGGSAGLAVLTTDLEASPFRLEFWMPDGTPLALAGAADRGSLTGAAPSPGLQFIDTPATAPAGWAELSGQKALTASALLRRRIDDTSDAEAALAFTPFPVSRFTVPFDNTLGYAGGAALVNRGSAAASVAAVVRNEDGRETARDTIRVDARSQKTFLFPEQFPASANRRGSIEFSAAAGELYAAGLRSGPQGPATAWNIAPPPEAAAARLLPFVADGQGWTTTIQLVNPSADPAPFWLVFRDDYGYPLPLSVGGADAAEEHFDIIPPGGTRILRTGGLSSPRITGWAEIASAAQVAALAIVRRPSEPAAEAVLPAAAAADGHFYLPFDNTAGALTSFGLVNPSLLDTGSAAVTFRDENGLVLATDVLQVDPYTSTFVTLPLSYAPLAARRGILDARLSGLRMFGLRSSSRGAISFLPLLPR